jgi:hypothetical protein
LCRPTVRILSPVLEVAQAREEHVIRRQLLRVVFKHSPLKILDCIWLVVLLRDLIELIRYRQAELM